MRASREQARLEQVQQPGQQLAPGQVAGGAEEHDDVRLVHLPTVGVLIRTARVLLDVRHLDVR